MRATKRYLVGIVDVATRFAGLVACGAWVLGRFDHLPFFSSALVVALAILWADSFYSTLRRYWSEVLDTPSSARRNKVAPERVSPSCPAVGLSASRKDSNPVMLAALRAVAGKAAAVDGGCIGRLVESDEFPRLFRIVIPNGSEAALCSFFMPEDVAEIERRPGPECSDVGEFHEITLSPTAS